MSGELETRAAEAVNSLDWDKIYKEARKRMMRDMTGSFYDEHLAHTVADSLASALSTPCVGGLDMEDGWQSIETAPKDGAPLLLSGPLDGPHDYRVKVGGWHAGGSRWYIFGASWSPTHWRPLPAPPLGKDEQ